MSEHWHIDDDGAELIVRDENRLTVSTLPRGSEDAVLIAAAPELAQALRDLLRIAPAFRTKPIGAPGSEARRQQDEHIAIEDAVKTLLKRIKP